MDQNKERGVPWILWPFWALWRLVAFIIEMTGRLVGLILGAVLGIPLALFGALLMVRSLF